MFCLGGGGASQIYKLTIKLEGGGFRLRWDGPARAGLARPGPARPGPGGTFNKGLEGPETLLQLRRRRGGGYINQELTLNAVCD